MLWVVFFKLIFAPNGCFFLVQMSLQNRKNTLESSEQKSARIQVTKVVIIRDNRTAF
jgi:hypothetical protein